MLAPIGGVFAISAFAAHQALAIPSLYGQSQKTFDLQGHRGGRGETVESTLASFAWGLINGVKTLELDNGITKDGAVIVWHDESIDGTKCMDTEPVTADDPDFPYVGKYIANLTLAQIKTLDCGSQRLNDFSEQLAYPGLKLSTLQELFAFVECVDSDRRVMFNIESKVDADFPNYTRTVDDFVELQYAAFQSSPYLHQITYQSFDWRTLIAMKSKDSSVPTAALISSGTSVGADNGTSNWLAGLRLDSFEGTTGVQVARAASAIDADILSPSGASDSTPVVDPNMEGFIYFTTEDMISEAHELGMEVKPWTINRMNIAQQLLEWGVDGIITDYPHALTRLLKQQKYRVEDSFFEHVVMKCFHQHAQYI
ncbi:PLC-like phosphodiesterase [Hymenopellis radicata]|nr:PLC-like phosphodiesterase [Hymenopellis radicata]